MNRWTVTTLEPCFSDKVNKTLYKREGVKVQEGKLEMNKENQIQRITCSR